MSYLLDTNVVSELRRRDRAAPAVVAWFRQSSGSGFFVSVLTMMEIETGIRRLELRDKPQAAALRAWKDGPLKGRFRDAIVGVDLEIAELCGRLMVPDPRPEIDALIAATAIVKGLTLVTRNERDFAGLPVALVNPWSPPD